MCLGIPGQIVEIIDVQTLMATVDVAGVQRPVNIVCVVDAEHPPEACLGEWVLVHVGFAMSRLDAAEAHKTLELLSELGETQEELTRMQVPQE